jgi:hypothetical protein
MTPETEPAQMFDQAFWDRRRIRRRQGFTRMMLKQFSHEQTEFAILEVNFKLFSRVRIQFVTLISQQQRVIRAVGGSGKPVILIHRSFSVSD